MLQAIGRLRQDCGGLLAGKLHGLDASEPCGQIRQALGDDLSRLSLVFDQDNYGVGHRTGAEHPCLSTRQRHVTKGHGNPSAAIQPAEALDG